MQVALTRTAWCLLAGCAACASLTAGRADADPLPLHGPHSSERAFLTDRTFKSPVTGETFVAQVLAGSAPAGKNDYDGCPHPAINTLQYLLVIDPETGYVEYPALFERPAPFSAAELKSIIGEPKFGRAYPEGLPWSGAYGWEKFENAAKLAEASQGGALTVGNCYLRAAWAVRLDVISGQNEFDEEVGELFAGLQLGAPNIGELTVPYEIQLARQLEELWERQQLVDTSERQFRLAMAWLYRSRGELKATTDYLGEKSVDEAVEHRRLEHFLRSSVTLEREYMLKASDWYTKAVNGGEVPVSDLGSACFILGEIQRRCGNLAGAGYWYALAGENNKGSITSNLLEQQVQAAASTRGY